MKNIEERVLEKKETDLIQQNFIILELHHQKWMDQKK
jgi:hypothetical protein